MAKLRLYLDVDGVINAEAPHGAWGERAPTSGRAMAGGYVYPIHWSPSMISALNHFIEEYDVELVWTTTWQDAAPTTLAGLIGFGAGARVLVPLSGEVTFPSIHWKREALVAEQMDDPSPFLWIDDEIWTTELSDAAILGGLAIAVNEFRGITPDNMRTMKEYAERHAIFDRKPSA